MTRSISLLPLTLAAAGIVAVASGGAPVAQEPRPGFRSGADVVTVDTSVRRGRRAVTGLKAEDFEVFDNGVAQQVDEVSYEKLPIDVTVLLDVSDSIRAPVLDELRRSVRQLRAGLGSSDRLKLTTFNMRIRRLAEFGGTGGSADNAFAALAGSGSSAIFDALAVALTSAPTGGRRQLVVLFSDGIDSSSITDPPVLLDVARRSAATIAAVLASPTRQLSASIAARPISADMTVRQLYDQLAGDTGGVVLATVAGDDLGSTFRRILDEFRASYVLYYSPRGVAREGFHTLEVRVKRAGADVRARRGYTIQ